MLELFLLPVDEATRLPAERFFFKLSTETVWKAILLCWSAVYTGLLNNIVVGEGSHFRQLFTALSAIHDVNLENSGVQPQNSLGVEERYHEPLCHTFRKLKIDYLRC